MNGFWNKAFRWINIIFIPMLLLLILGITGYRIHKNEPPTNSPVMTFLVALLFILMIAGKIRRNFASGSFLRSRFFENMSITAIIILGMYVHHFYGFKGLLFVVVMLPVLVILLYGLYKLFKRKRG